MPYLDASTADIRAIDALEHYINLVTTTATERTAILVVLPPFFTPFLRHTYFVCLVRTVSIKPYTLASSAESQ